MQGSSLYFLLQVPVILYFLFPIFGRACIDSPVFVKAQVLFFQQHSFQTPKIEIWELYVQET